MRVPDATFCTRSLTVTSGPGICSESVLPAAGTNASHSLIRPQESCDCLSCDRRRVGLTCVRHGTQSPPDPRMNPSPEHLDRLSLGRILALSPSVTRQSRLVSALSSCRLSGNLSDLCVATFACNRDTLFLYLCAPIQAIRSCPVVYRHCRSTFDKSRTSVLYIDPNAAEHRQTGLHG